VQRQGETAEKFAEELTKLFGQAYPTEVPMSEILLQQFLTGLFPSVSR